MTATAVTKSKPASGFSMFCGEEGRTVAGNDLRTVQLSCAMCGKHCTVGGQTYK